VTYGVSVNRMVVAFIFKGGANTYTQTHSMSTFFGDLQSSSIQKPDSVFDQSSMLPPLDTSSYGPGFNGVPDGRINAGTSLFSDVTPYGEYGKGDRLSTQTAYLANPHNIQKIVPQLMLPDCNIDSRPTTFLLPHSVSDGDVAFSIRFTSDQARNAHMKGFQDFTRQGAGRALDYVCNLATVNYIMRGMFTNSKHVNPAWEGFAVALGFGDQYKEIQKTIDMVSTKDKLSEAEHKHIRNRMRCMAENLVRDNFRPLGVVIGSQKQGGQHEVSNSAVTWPVAYVVTISIDGRNENLCNYWRHMHVSSGSDLDFVVQMKTQLNYTLNNSKQITQKQFSHNATRNEHVPHECPQLCPAVNGKSSEPMLMRQEGKTGHKSKLDKELTGHWHFSMSQMMQQQITGQELFASATSFHVGALIQSTVSIVWIRKRAPDPAYIKHGSTLDLDSDPVMKSMLGGSDGFAAAAFATITAQPKGAQYLNYQINPRNNVIQGRIALVEKSKYARNEAPAIPSIDPSVYRSSEGSAKQVDTIPHSSVNFTSDKEMISRGLKQPEPPRKVQRMSPSQEADASVGSTPLINQTSTDMDIDPAVSASGKKAPVKVSRKSTKPPALSEI
jgi:hypothetical protein